MILVRDGLSLREPAQKKQPRDEAVGWIEHKRIELVLSHDGIQHSSLVSSSGADAVQEEAFFVRRKRQGSTLTQHAGLPLGHSC